MNQSRFISRMWLAALSPCADVWLRGWCVGVVQSLSLAVVYLETSKKNNDICEWGEKCHGRWLKWLFEDCDAKAECCWCESHRKYCISHLRTKINWSSEEAGLFIFGVFYYFSSPFLKELDFRPLFCHGCIIVQSFIYRMCLKRSAVLYLSSPLHCNHWFVPVGHHGWPSCCLLLAGFSGWNLVFWSHYCFCVCFSLTFIPCPPHIPPPLSVSLFLSVSSPSVRLANSLTLLAFHQLFKTNTNISFLISFL